MFQYNFIPGTFNYCLIYQGCKVNNLKLEFKTNSVISNWGNFSFVMKKQIYNFVVIIIAEVAELVDAHDSKSCSLGSEGSSPSFGTGSILIVLHHKTKIVSKGYSCFYRQPI